MFCAMRIQRARNISPPRPYISVLGVGGGWEETRTFSIGNVASEISAEVGWPVARRTGVRLASVRRPRIKRRFRGRVCESRLFRKCFPGFGEVSFLKWLMGLFSFLEAMDVE